MVMKQPPEVVWSTIRDSMSEIVPLMSDVESVRVIEREERSDGTVRFLNEWRLRSSLPSVAESVIKPDELGWLDHALWKDSERCCNWRIEPFFHPESIKCGGVTTYESAIGGRGTRITFQGDVEIDIAKLAGLSKALSRPLSSVIENVVRSLVPRNFRKVYEAAEQWLQSGRH